jgi:hypothetical protein
MRETYDLRELTGELTNIFPEIEALYLFGSRRYRTGSLRSVVDILVELREASHIRPQELRAFSAEFFVGTTKFLATRYHGAASQLPQNTYRGRRMTLAIRAKSLSNVKSVALCSEAIAAIRASVVVTATPFARAARKILAASRYVGNPFGSRISHCER